MLNCFPEKYAEEKQKALQFLQKTQNGDGSFGTEEDCVLSTALARMSLKYFENENLKSLSEKSENFLLNNQQKDGSWKAENFIKPKANEPYKSKTLTTAFALKSLL